MMWFPKTEKMADVVACLLSEFEMPSSVSGVVGKTRLTGIESVVSTK